jgi:hypothetical protein
MSRLSIATVNRPNPVRRILVPLGLWTVMAIVAILNGIFRETVMIPRTGEYRGHVTSTALLVAAILAISYTYFKSTDTEYTRGELLIIGVAWTVLTVGFEFLVGYVEGAPVEETISQYDVFAGQVWIAVPVALLTAPLLFGAVVAE